MNITMAMINRNQDLKQQFLTISESIANNTKLQLFAPIYNDEAFKAQMTRDEFETQKKCLFPVEILR